MHHPTDRIEKSSSSGFSLSLPDWSFYLVFETKLKILNCIIGYKHEWYNKACSMCYPVCGMVHIKEPLLLIGNSSPCGSSGFPFSLS